MSDLAAFLLARIAEDTVEAGRAYSETLPLHVFDCEWETFGCNCVGPARVRVELEAKRRIVERALEMEPLYAHQGEDGPAAVLVSEYAVVLHLLALPYAGHPDFDEAWRL